MTRIGLLTSRCIVAAFVITLSGCIDLPETGPSPPDYKAQVRVVFADPALPTAHLAMADGATSVAFADRFSGPYGSVTGYATYPAGAKRVVVRKPDGSLADADTATTTLGTETVSTLVLLPRRTAAEQRILRLGERYTFSLPGMPDSARVRFFNALASKDTVDVWAIRGSVQVPARVSDNLRYGIASTFFNVPRDSTWRFFLSRSTGTAGISDTFSVVGASNTQHTVVVHDSLSRVRLLSITG